MTGFFYSANFHIQSVDEPMVSEVYAESDIDNGSSNEENNKSDDEKSTSSESESEDVWSGIVPEILSGDIENPSPLPVAQNCQTSLQKVNSLVFWFVYFLLI